MKEEIMLIIYTGDGPKMALVKESFSGRWGDK